jgi:DNA (cytosine-5)-methyltransferase 1
MLIEPFVLSQASGGSPRSVEEPIPTQTTGGNGAAHALISPYYGSGSGETCNSVDESLPTITAKARFGMVVPVTNSNGGAQPRDIATDPLATMTTAKGGEFAIVLPVTHAGGHDRVLDPNDTPLPTVTGANRGELAFITAQHGERPGQAPRVHDIDQPAPTIAATGHVDLVQATPHYDILFRMLEPHELAAAMGFNTDDAVYEFAGTKTEKIKQIGNAVSVAKMKACVGAILADAAPKRKPTVEDEYLEAAE